jgi:hypothetical protein
MKNMKKTALILFSVIFLSSINVFSQDSAKSSPNHPDRIKSGFYFKIGAVLPVGTYATGQTLAMHNTVFTPSNYTLTYLPAKIGPSMDLGFLIYLGPSFANNYVRAGIDATFLTFWFNTTTPVINGDKRYEHYYYFGGQKFGPIITVNPIDRLMVDVSYKLCFNLGYHYDEWKDIGLADAQYSKYGEELLNQEMSLSLRYSLMIFSFQYDFGTMAYNNFDSARPDQKIPIDTFRILFGIKF